MIVKCKAMVEIKKYKAVRVTDRTRDSKNRVKRDGQKEIMMEEEVKS